ncbi:MAG: spore maturation protein [Bacillota bacterium]|nr:spore maturation protein [Bacillota bacterium]
MQAVSIISAAIVPSFIVLIVIYGLIKKVDVYNAFVEGAKEGLNTAVKILPYVAAMMLAVGIFSASGGFDMITGIFEKPAKALGIPAEVLPLFLVRPFSGSAAMAVLADIFKNSGPDSFAGLLASTMMGSSETIFYTSALYFGAARIKKTRYAIPLALCSEIIGLISSVLVCTWAFS